jgi:hypothetical protein
VDGNEKCAMKMQIDRILTSVVVLSWDDLRHVSQRGLIHIEYAPGKSLEYLKIWQLTGKGEWSLVCEYWMPHGTTVAARDGMTFSNDYHSAGLAGMLEVIMQHQDSFAAPLIAPGAGLIQVTPPTDQESVAATECMRCAYKSLGLTFCSDPYSLPWHKLRSPRDSGRFGGSSSGEMCRRGQDLRPMTHRTTPEGNERAV